MKGPEVLEAEYRGADEVLMHLVAFEVRRAARRPRDRMPAAGRPAPVAAAVDDAVAAGRPLAGESRRSPLGLVARQAVADAVAAEVLRTRFPTEAARLERPWRTAVEVRARLAALGPEAEKVAVRILPSWRLPLQAVPGVVATLTPAAARERGAAASTDPAGARGA